MTRQEFEEYPYLCAELREQERRSRRNKAEETGERESDPQREVLRQRLGEMERLVQSLPNAQERLIGQKVMEHGGPVPWKQIVAELGYRWTIGKARYVYARMCTRCFSKKEEEI